MRIDACSGGRSAGIHLTAHWATAGAQLARAWPGQGTRDDTALALSGLLARAGWPVVAESLAANVALAGLLCGYLLHLVADSLTRGGVPWLWPSHARFGFPPKRSWRFTSGSVAEPIVVVAVAVAVIVAVFTHLLAI